MVAAFLALAGLLLAGLMIQRDRWSLLEPRPHRSRSLSAPVALFEAAPDGGVEIFNESFRRLVGPASEGEGVRLDLARRLVDAEGRARWRAWLEAGDHEERLQLRTRLRRGGEVSSDILLTAEWRRAEDGSARVTGALTEALDVTAALRRAEAEAGRLREIIARAPVGMATFDPSGRVGAVWNRAAESMLGWSAEEVEGEVVPLLPAPLAVHGPGVEAPGGEGGREVRRWRRDGEAIDLSIATAPIGDGTGERVAILQDITERLRNDNERRRLSEIVRTTPDLVLILDVDGQLLYQNPAAGARMSEVGVGRGAERLGADWAARWHQEIVPVVAAGSSWTGELRLGREAGFLASVVVAGHRSHEGDLAYLSVLARDISEQRSVEEQLRQSQKLEAVGQLSGGIAHDFNNLLTVVQANSELLAEDAAGAHETALLSDIQAAVRRGRDLVRRLMVFSRDESLSVRPFSLVELEDYVRTLRRLLPETVTVEWECVARDPVVRADPGALQQILLNLATNARDAMPGGGTLRLRVSECGDGGDGGRLEIAVSDTGTGIAPGDLERVFEPFYTTKTPGKGTGLGLSMVYGLVGELGGEIFVESEPGAGTTFRMRFPGAERVPGARDPEVRGPAARLEGGSETILIVEDEEAIRRVAQRTLERSGYRVLQAGDGEAGWELFEERSAEIDLVLSDVVMPRLSGPALLNRIRGAGHAVPFMLMSGYTEREARRESGVDEGVPMLPKPWTRDDLHNAVARVLASARAAAVS